ncbi:MAG: hypothetical protein RLZ12_827 [Bacillota bacterium]|jgi:hypothetical protein
MSLTVLFSGRGEFAILQGETQSFFYSCCSSSNNPNSPNNFCTFKMVYATATITNYPYCFESNCNPINPNPAPTLTVTPFFQGRPITLDCSNYSGVPVETGNTKTITISSLCDELKVFYPPTDPTTQDKPALAAYFLSIGICPTT